MKRTSILSVATVALVLMLALAAPAASVSCSGVAAWSPNSVAYSTGALVTYNGSEYKCLQAHTSQAGWDPADVPALWSLVGTCTTGGATPTPTATAKPTATATATAKPTATATAKPTATATATAKPTATATAKPTATATATAKPTATPTPGSGGSCAGVSPWAVGVAYSVGSLVTYQGNEYKSTLNETSETGWDPVSAPALWTLVGSCTGGTGGTPTPVPPPPPPPGTKEFAPYVDMSLTGSNNLSSIASASGIKTFTLAFIINNGACAGGWAGLGVTLPADNYPDGSTVASLISGVGAGNVIISFGGASGTELGEACSSASAVQAQYQAVINKYGVKRLDYDIEGAPIADTAAVDRRNAALASLESANSGLEVSYTLPVLPSGLTQDGVNLMSNAVSHGVKVAVVNVMAMDYGSAVANGQMGPDADSAASATHNQANSVGLSTNIGITPMIGNNDSAGETFTLSDAQTVLNYANSNSWVTRLSYWSVGRDNGNCSGGVSPSCSGISQSAYAFAHVFESF